MIARHPPAQPMLKLPRTPHEDLETLRAVLASPSFRQWAEAGGLPLGLAEHPPEPAFVEMERLGLAKIWSDGKYLRICPHDWEPVQ